MSYRTKTWFHRSSVSIRRIAIRRCLGGDSLCPEVRELRLDYSSGNALASAGTHNRMAHISVRYPAGYAGTPDREQLRFLHAVEPRLTCWYLIAVTGQTLDIGSTHNGTYLGLGFAWRWRMWIRPASYGVALGLRPRRQTRCSAQRSAGGNRIEVGHSTGGFASRFRIRELSLFSALLEVNSDTISASSL